MGPTFRSPRKGAAGHPEFENIILRTSSSGSGVVRLRMSVTSPWASRAMGCAAGFNSQIGLALGVYQQPGPMRLVA